MAQKPTAKKSMADDPKVAQTIQNYEQGLRAMQEHKFDKARTHFKRSSEAPARNSPTAPVCTRMRAISTWTRSLHQFKTSEEHFDYAVSLMNLGDYVQAREHMEKLQKQSPKADYVVYGLAALDCMTGR